MALVNSKSRGDSSALSPREILLEEYRKKLGNASVKDTNTESKTSTSMAEQDLASAYQKNANPKTDQSTNLMNQRNAQSELLNYGKAMAGLNAQSSPENYKKYEEAKTALLNKGYTKDEIYQSESLARQLSKEESRKNTQEFAKKHPIMGSVISLASNLMAPAEIIENVGNYLSGKSDIKQSNNVMSNLTQNLRQGASSDMGKIGNFAYNNVLMPIMDNATAMLVGGGFKGSQIVGAGQAADSAYDKAKENGSSTENALATAVASGTLSYLTDAFSLGNLEKMKASGNTGLANAVKDIGKQITVEGSEETADELLNQIADVLINQENSQQVRDYNEYINSGLSEKDAKRQVAKDSLKQIGLSGLAGGISGGVMGSGMTAYNNIVNRSSRNAMAELDPLNAFGLNEAMQDADGAVTEATNDSLKITSPTVLNVKEEASPDSARSVNVGKVTHIKSLYNGDVPTQVNTNEHRVQIAQESYEDAVINMNSADIDSALSGRNIRKILTHVYENIFSPGSTSKDIVVNGTRFKDKAYTVTVNKNAVGKIMSDPNLSAEKIAVLDDIEEIVGSANYVGSGNYIAHGSKNKSDVTRYDYFETTANINGQPYIVSFDVEVHPNTNNYRTHKVINEINLTKSPDMGPAPTADRQPSTDTGPVPAVSVGSSSLFNNNIPNSADNVNTAVKSAEGDIDNFVPTSYGNGNGIDSYDSHTAENLTSDKGVTSNDVAYQDFVNETLNDKDFRKVYYFGKVSNELSDDIFSSTGLDLEGFNIISDSDSIRHSMKKHSDAALEAKKGQVALDAELLAKLPEVYNNPDNIKLSKKTDSRGRDVIKFTKRINGIIVVANAISNGRNRLALDTMYIKNSHPTRLDANLPQAQRPERSVGKATFDNSIPNSADNVNAEVGNQRVRGYNDTLVNKTDAPQELKEEFINNPDMYTQLSNAKTLAKAVEILENNSIDAAIAQYHSLLDKRNPVAVPLGYNISKQLSQDGRLDESVQIVREMSRALTESGQFSQAAAITMLNNDPEAAKRYLIREIDTLNQKGAEKFGKKWTDFELTESELQEFNGIQSGDSEAIKALYDKVYARLRKEYPATVTEKLMEFRRISMLLNVRTNVRNVVSNALLMPVRWTADRVSALGEGVYSLINPKYERTQSLNPIRSKQAKQLASEAFETVKSEMLGENKYEDAKGAMRDKQVFKGGKTAQMIDALTNGAITKANRAMGKDADPSLMETARNFTYWLLEKGDNTFVKKNFESRMASYIAAQGITDLENIPADAYVLATQEALKATFKDDSALANGLSAFRQMLNKAPGGMLGDVVMPFTKTPANLAMRGIDYSPAGVYNGLKTLQNAKSNVDVAKGFTQLGQAATGTAAILLGYALAEAGWITGALSDDKDEAQFQKQQGQLAYSVKTPLGYLTYDWAQPASIPLILGVTIYDSWNNKQDFVGGLKQGTLAAVDSWLELSPLQNMSEIFGGYGTPAENVRDVIANDFPLSFIPAQMGAMAKVGDTTQRVTYDNTSDWNSFLNQAKAKIPGLSEELPIAYDTWGNPIQRQDSTGEAVFANILNPGQFGNENVTSIDDEISALYDATGDASVFPKKASWSYQINKKSVKLNNEQYSEFQKIMGENSYQMASALIESDTYNQLSDEQRAEAIADMFSFADALAKREVLGYDVENSDTYKKTYSVYQERGAEGVSVYLSIKQNQEGQKNVDMINAVDALDISVEDKGYYLSVLKGTLSKAAQAAYDESGYEGVYHHYAEKAAEDNAEKSETNSGSNHTSGAGQADAVSKIRAIRNQNASGASSEAIAKIAAMRSEQVQVTPEMVAKIAALRG